VRRVCVEQGEFWCAAAVRRRVHVCGGWQPALNGASRNEDEREGNEGREWCTGLARCLRNTNRSIHEHRLLSVLAKHLDDC